MADTATIADLIDRIKAEGQLTRNTGTNSIKVTNTLLLGIKDISEQTLIALTGQATVLQDFINDADRLAALAGLNNQGGAGGGGGAGDPNPADNRTGGGPVDIGLLATLGAAAIGGLIGMFKGWINAIKFFTPKKILTAIEGVGSSIVKVIRDFGTMGRNALNSVRTAVLGLDGPLLKIKNGIMYIVKPFVEAGKTIFNIVKNVLGFGDTVSGIAKYFKGLFKIIKSVSGIVGKLFLPLTIIMTVFDTIKAMIAGYAEGGILGALEGGITGFFNSLIFGPLDLLKDLVSWVLGKLGFENAAKTLDSFSFSQIFSDLVSGVFSLVDDVIVEIKKYFTDVVEGFKTGGVWGGLGAMLTGYFDMMVMKPLDLLKDLVSWAADIFGFENASKWLDSFSFSEMFTAVVDWISAIPQKLVEYFEDMWVDMKGKLLSGMVAFAFWVGGLGDRIYLSILEYLKGTTVGSYLVDDEMVAGARAKVDSTTAMVGVAQQQIMANTEAEKKALMESRVQRHAEEAAARAAAAPQPPPNIDARSGGNNTSTTATQVTNYYANQGSALDGAYMPF